MLYYYTIILGVILDNAIGSWDFSFIPDKNVTICNIKNIDSTDDY